MGKNIFIGTSGYSYPHWKGVFYPTDLSSNKWLEFYARHFNVVELNVTFYRLPSKKSFENWYNKTPKNFKFVIKGSRFITHVKKLNECREPLETFFDNASGLKEKLLCVLWQLPPSFKFNLERLDNFLKLIKNKRFPCLHSFEFRNDSWFNEETYSLLKENNTSLCIADSPVFPRYEELTSSFIYLRLHGGKILYGSEYAEDELNSWADKTTEWLKDKKLFLAFFNNDSYGFAVKNALKFKETLNSRQKTWGNFSDVINF
ncbi:MAG: DUF72 domain-containing protein [bacterium]